MPEPEVIDSKESRGIVRELGELGPGAIVTLAGLARMLDCCETTIRRAVDREEIPPPTRLLGGQVWTAGAIVRHIEARLEREAREAARIKV